LTNFEVNKSISLFSYQTLLLKSYIEETENKNYLCKSFLQTNTLHKMNFKFKKIYIEITNRCNFSCSFCFSTSRASKFMSPDEFKIIAQKIRLHTSYIYLHVLGEPLLHPALDEILSVAEDLKFNINITTNGALLDKKKDLLLKHKIRQINISLHDAEENVPVSEWDAYMNSVFSYIAADAAQTYINLRLWNSGAENKNDFNRYCLAKISELYQLPFNTDYSPNGEVKHKLGEHLFMQFAPRFQWPDGEHIRSLKTKTCYALRDHIAILSDGTVVPCCIDADSHLKLGNIFENDLNQILNTPRSIKIRNGFANNKVVEDYCLTCGFMV